MESYEEILGQMRREYTEKSGWEPEMVSDTGLKLQVLAGELYRLMARVEWLKKQAFPQTADGPWLDLHGAQRGVERRGSQKAAGKLAFSRYLPISFEVVIPKGTVCASYGEEAVEYETTEDGVLPAGEVTVLISAQAVEGGKKGNAAASYINTLVSEVNGINYVVNLNAFTGGEDPEDDESYRARVTETYRLIGLAGGAGWYEAMALEQEGITGAQAVPREDGAGTVGVYVWGEGEAPAQEVLDALNETLQRDSEADVTVTVKAAQTKKVPVVVSIRVKPGAVYTQAREKVIAALKAWFAERRIGDAVYLGDLNRVILEADPAVCGVTFNSGTTGYAGAAGMLPKAGSIAVSEDK